VVSTAKESHAGQGSYSQNGLLSFQRPQLVDNQIEEIQYSLAEQNKSGGGGWEALANRKYWRVLFIGNMLNIFQQITGINTVIYYAPTILIAAGFSQDQSLLITFVVAIPQLSMIFGSIWLIERVKRRTMFISGLSVMVAALTALGLGFFDVNELRSVFLGTHGDYDNPDLEGAYKWLAVFGMLLFRLSFAMGLGPLPQTIASEIYPSTIRGKGLALASMINWSFNFAVSLSFLPLLQGLGATITYWMYALFALVALLFVIIMVPETKGVSLEELERQLIKD